MRFNSCVSPGRQSCSCLALRRQRRRKAMVRPSGREPKQTQEVSVWGFWGGGVRGCSLTLPNCSLLLPLLHSARHLKALVMHSSSPATSSVIQFPRQWGCVKFQLRLCVRRAVKTSLPPSCFVCLLLSPHKKQQEPGRWCNLGIYHSGKKWIWILQLFFSRLN